MIASGIFALLLMFLWSMHRRSSRTTAFLFFLAFAAIALLFRHHVTESLGLSF
ncbi:MAG: hypothetical protein GY895_22100 [Phycisphaera sp.]|nr:hypothetical protein [Phycisphaera sp.]